MTRLVLLDLIHSSTLFSQIAANKTKKRCFIVTSIDCHVKKI